jgi:hypothetical protein
MLTSHPYFSMVWRVTWKGNCLKSYLILLPTLTMGLNIWDFIQDPMTINLNNGYGYMRKLKAWWQIDVTCGFLDRVG